MFATLLLFGVSLPSRARFAVKTILLPERDHAGWKLLASAAVILVKALGLLPSPFITQMFSVP
jgi:hypothetical protein